MNESEGFFPPFSSQINNLSQPVIYMGHSYNHDLFKRDIWSSLKNREQKIKEKVILTEVDETKVANSQLKPNTGLQVHDDLGSL